MQGDSWTITFQDELNYTFFYEKEESNVITISMKKTYLKENSTFYLASNDYIKVVTQGSKRYQKTSFSWLLFTYLVYKIPLKEDFTQIKLLLEDKKMDLIGS